MAFTGDNTLWLLNKLLFLVHYGLRASARVREIMTSKKRLMKEGGRAREERDREKGWRGTETDSITDIK